MGILFELFANPAESQLIIDGTFVLCLREMRTEQLGISSLGIHEDYNCF